MNLLKKIIASFRLLLPNPLFLAGMTFTMVLAIILLLISLVKSENISTVSSSPLELAGEIAYHEAGCIHCHTMYIRPEIEEVFRYLPEYGSFKTPYTDTSRYSRDHLVSWGSRRIGPDLSYLASYPQQRAYVREYILNPRHFFKGSFMPSYEYLAKDFVKGSYVIHFMKGLSVIESSYSFQNSTYLESILNQTTRLDAIMNFLYGEKNRFY